jgi:basic membrane protein A
MRCGGNRSGINPPNIFYGGKKMKKILALLLALCMIFALAACGETQTEEKTEEPETETTEPETETTEPETETTEPETETTEPETEESDVRVAMITDYGDITDQSFNQTTYEACKEYCEANGLEFKYYKPGSDSDDDRITMIENAIEEGFNVIVMPGYAFAPAIAATAPEYEDVLFIALDVSEYDLTSAGLETLPENLYSAVYQEELCGYMAGYAAVKLGYKNLGFLGGMAVPAVIRYGYGFVQGADAAAAELGLTDVVINYAYGNQFYGDADITAAMDTWYAGGTEIVFACGGGIFTSAAEAAAKVDGKVIGVDVDQAATIDGLYGEGMTVTSAMKGLAPTVKTMLAAVQNGTFKGGVVENLGLVGTDPEANYVQLPSATTQFSDSFTLEDYQALVAAMFNGEITVSNDITVSAADLATVVTVNDLGNLK